MRPGTGHRPLPVPHPDRADHEIAVVDRLPEDIRACVRALNDLPTYYVIGTSRVDGRRLTVGEVHDAVLLDRACPVTVLETLAHRGLLRPSAAAS